MNEYCNWDRKTTKTADFNFCYVHFRLMPLREAWIHIFSCQLYRKSRGRLDSLDSNHYQEKNTSELRIEKRLSGWNFRIRNGLQRELVWFEPVNIMTNVKKTLNCWNEAFLNICHENTEIRNRHVRLHQRKRRCSGASQYVKKEEDE